MTIEGPTTVLSCDLKVTCLLSLEFVICILFDPVIPVAEDLALLTLCIVVCLNLFEIWLNV